MVKIGQRTGVLEARTYGGDIWVVPNFGGQARRLAPDGNYPVWHPSGRKIAYISGPEAVRSILEVASEGGMPHTVVSSESSSREIVRVRYSPHANWITFDTAESEIFIVPIAGGQPRKLVNGFSHVWEPSGTRLYYIVRDPAGGTRLQSIGIDERTGNITGQPSTVGLMTGILRDLAVSHTGRQLAVTEDEGSMNLTRLPLTPDGSAPAGAEEELSAGQVFDGQPKFSPDGRRLAYTSNRLGRDQLWMLHLDDKRIEVLQLPGDDLSVVGPNWYPGGRRLNLLRRFPDGKISLWWIAADGSDAGELVAPESLYNNAEGWPIAPDGQRMVYGATVDGHSQLFEFDLGTRKARQLTSSSDDKFSAIYSPDPVRWRQGRTSHPRRRPRSTHVLFTGWALAVFPTRPLEHLPHAGRWWSRSAGDPLSGVEVVSRRAGNLSRRTIPCLRAEQRRVVALGVTAWRRAGAGPIIGVESCRRREPRESTGAI
jgi:Tol biopolymer transport system component